MPKPGDAGDSWWLLFKKYDASVCGLSRNRLTGDTRTRRVDGRDAHVPEEDVVVARSRLIPDVHAGARRNAVGHLDWKRLPTTTFWRTTLLVAAGPTMMPFELPTAVLASTELLLPARIPMPKLGAGPAA